MTGEQLRDEGCAKVDASSSEEWKNNCDNTICLFAWKGLDFTAEDIRALIPEPPHPNAMGARFLAAIKAEIIERIGYRKAKRPSAHARVLAVYRGCK